MSLEMLLLAGAIVAGIVALLLLASLFRWHKRLIWLRCVLAILFVLMSIGFGASWASSRPFVNEPAPLSPQTLVYSARSHLADETGTTSADTVTLQAFEGHTGQLRWSRDLPGESFSALAHYQQTLYVATISYHPATEETFASLDAQSGTIHWQQTVSLAGDFDVLTVIMPTAFYLLTSATKPVNSTGTLTALSTANGLPLWHQSWIYEPEQGVAHASLAADATTIYLLLPSMRPANNPIIAVRASDGRQLWQTPLGSIVTYGLGAGGGVVYAISYGEVLALRATDGGQIWTWGKADNSLGIHAVVAGDTDLYLTAQESAPATDSKGRLTNPEKVYALDYQSGTVKWTFATASGNAGTLDLAGASLYIDADDGIHALRASDGTALWHINSQTNYHLPGIQGMILQPAPDTVMFMTSTETFTKDLICFLCTQYRQDYLYALNAQTGMPYWHVKLGPVYRINLRWVTLAPHSSF